MTSHFPSLRISALALLAISIAAGPLGCATQKPYSPADAARAKVAFLRAEGAHLNPLQRSLIQQLPYARSGNLKSRMMFVRDRGGNDPGHVTGYERRSLSEALAKRKNQGSTSEEERADLGEEPSVDPKR